MLETTVLGKHIPEGTSINNIKHLARIISLALVGFSIVLIAGCGNSISNTPAQAINDFYQSLNEKNCDKNLELRSANLKFSGKPGATHEEELAACEKFVRGNLPAFSEKIDEVKIDENKAEVKDELTIKSKTSQVIDKGTIYLIVEDGKWKIDKVSDDAPNPIT